MQVGDKEPFLAEDLIVALVSVVYGTCDSLEYILEASHHAGGVEAGHERGQGSLGEIVDVLGRRL